MISHRKTVPEREVSDEETSDREFFFDEFEALLTEIKRAALALRSSRLTRAATRGDAEDDLAGAIESLREAETRASDLQHHVLDYVSNVESEDEGDEGDEEEEEEEDEEEEESPSSEPTEPKK